MALNKLFCKLSAVVLFALPLVANSSIITIDNSDLGFSSSGLRTSEAKCCVDSAIGGYYMVDQKGSQGDYAIWDPTGYEEWVAGLWKVEMNWTSYWNRSKAAPVTINTINAADVSLFVDQRFNGGSWVDLGTYAFSQTSASVKIDDSKSSSFSYFVADAVRFTLVKATESAVSQVNAPSGLALLALSGLALVGFRRSK